MEFANEANRWGLIHAYVAACKRVRSIEKGAADAASEAVIHAFCPSRTYWLRGKAMVHLFMIFLMGNSWKVPRKRIK